MEGSQHLLEPGVLQQDLHVRFGNHRTTRKEVLGLNTEEADVK